MQLSLLLPGVQVTGTMGDNGEHIWGWQLAGKGWGKLESWPVQGWLNRERNVLFYTVVLSVFIKQINTSLTWCIFLLTSLTGKCTPKTWFKRPVYQQYTTLRYQLLTERWHNTIRNILALCLNNKEESLSSWKIFRERNWSLWIISLILYKLLCPCFWDHRKQGNQYFHLQYVSITGKSLCDWKELCTRRAL